MNPLSLELQAERYLERTGRGDLPVVIVADAYVPEELAACRARAAELVEGGHTVELIVVSLGDAWDPRPGERWVRFDGPVLCDFMAGDLPGRPGEKASVDLIVGPFGSGKSVACCWRLFLAAYDQEPDPDGVRRSRWLVVRNTYSELQTTTIETMRQWLDRYGTFSRTPPYAFNFRYLRDDGARVRGEFLFLALDHEADARKLASLEVTGGFVNEIREVPRGVVATLRGRADRYPKRRPDGTGGATRPFVIGDTNPWDEEHWLVGPAGAPPRGWAVRWQPGAVVKRDGRWEPNPAAENLSALSPTYYRTMIQGQGEDWIRVYAAAQVGFVREGEPVYREYRDHAHTAPAVLTPLPNREVIVGLDAGLWPAAIFMQVDDEGVVLILDELVGEGLGAQRFALNAIVPLIGSGRYQQVSGFVGAGDPAGLARSATAEGERSWLAIIEEHAGFRCRPAPTNDPEKRLQAVNGPLTRMFGPRPGLLVSPHCRTLRRALSGGFRYRRLKVSGERYELKPEKNRWSHPADALAYGCLWLGEHEPAFGRPRGRKRRIRQPEQAVTAYNELGHSSTWLPPA